jgi:hypothetical protein
MKLPRVASYDRSGRLQANADGTVVVDKGTLRGNPPDNGDQNQQRGQLGCGDDHQSNCTGQQDTAVALLRW